MSDSFSLGVQYSISKAIWDGFLLCGSAERGWVWLDDGNVWVAVWWGFFSGALWWLGFCNEILVFYVVRF